MKAFTTFQYHRRSTTRPLQFGLGAYKLEHAEPAQGLVLATAHPAKFGPKWLGKPSASRRAPGSFAAT